MNATPDPQPPAAPARSRAWIAWVVVILVGAAIGASFLFDRSSTSPAAKNGARATPVTAVGIARGDMTQRGRYPGELDADTADVAAFYAGRVVAIRVRVGDTVKANDVIAELDPVDAKEQIAQARAQAKAAAAERNRANVERDAAAAEVARLEPLARDKLISELEIDRQRAKAAALGASVESASASEAEAQARVRLLEKRIVESVVRAPFAGRVADRYVDPGAIVAAGARLIRVVAVAPLRVRFEVPESDVAQLAAGTLLTVTTQGSAGKGVQAKVSGVASEVSRERRVANVEALIETPPAGWLPGMYAEATVDLRTISQATIVPAAAVLSRLQADGKVAVGVFVVGDGGVARWIAVREVAREGDRVAVDGTLAADAKVLVAGHVDLGDGSKITLGGSR
ncbi:MAG TPA: efflux RND transporter periplasmic adaptor subunit [Kofleriaceae bacterium]